MSGTPEKRNAVEASSREIGTGQVARMLDVSVSSVYRYVDSGDLHPRNALPPRLRIGWRKRTLKFSVEEVKKLRERLRQEREN